MFDAAILPPRVHGLDHHEHPAFVLRVENLLKRLQLFAQLIEIWQVVFLPSLQEKGLLILIDVVERKFRSLGDQIPFKRSTGWHGSESVEVRAYAGKPTGRPMQIVFRPR